MKSIKYILFIGLVLLFSCEDEKESDNRGYPSLRTLQVTNITENGARFNAEIIGGENYEIENYGFIWNDYALNTISDGSIDKLVISEKINNNTFSADISTTLKEDKKYCVRAFVKTKDYQVYGEIVEFISLGSNAPEIISFSPTIGTWGDTISIKGENFSFKRYSNLVRLGEVFARVDYISDTLLKAIVPNAANEQVVDLSVEIAGNRSVAKEKFKYIKPTINITGAIEAAYGDTILVTGENINKEHVRIIFDNINSIVVLAQEDKIEFVVPTELNVTNCNIILELTGFKETIEFKLKSPIIQLGDYTAGFGDTIQINGTNLNPSLSQNKILFGTFEGDIIEVSKSFIKAVIPNTINYAHLNLYIKSGTLNELLGSFKLILPKISAIHPQVITNLNQTIEIVGEKFNTSADRNHLEVYYKESDSWSKLYNTEILSVERNKITIKLSEKGFYNPLLTFSADVKIRIYGSTFDNYTTCKLIHRGPFIRLKDFPGTFRHDAVGFSCLEYGYFGAGFNSQSDPLKDFWKYNPSNDVWNQISDLPGEPRGNAVGFTFNNKGFIGCGQTRSLYLRDFYQYDPSTNLWNKLSDIPGQESMYAFSFYVQNEPHVGLGNNLLNDIWKYNVSNDTWDQKALLSMPGYRTFAATTNQHTLMFYKNEVYKLNDKYTLEKLLTIEWPNSVWNAYSIDQVVYFGSDQKLFALNPSTNNLKQYTLKGEFFYHDNIYLEIGGKVYIIFSSTHGNPNQVWEFDPAYL